MFRCRWYDIGIVDLVAPINQDLLRSFKKGVPYLKRLVIVLVVLIAAMVFISIKVQQNPLGGGHDEEAEKAAQQKPEEKSAPPPVTKVQKLTPDPKTMELKGHVVTSASGLKYADIKVGTGKSPMPNDTVAVKYTGCLVNGEVFDSTDSHGGKPATFGVNQVIPGWTEALLSMKTGGKRKVIIPPAIGYGPNGNPPNIPPDATLVFEIELVSIEKTPAQ